MHGRRTDAKALGIRKILSDIAVGDLSIGNALFIGAPNDLVVDIRKILHKSHVEAAVLKIPAKHIEHDEAARVADMEKIIYGRPAGVHFYFARFKWDKFLFFSG